MALEAACQETTSTLAMYTGTHRINLKASWGTCAETGAKLVRSLHNKPLYPNKVSDMGVLVNSSS